MRCPCDHMMTGGCDGHRGPSEPRTCLRQRNPRARLKQTERLVSAQREIEAAVGEGAECVGLVVDAEIR